VLKPAALIREAYGKNCKSWCQVGRTPIFYFLSLLLSGGVLVVPLFLFMRSVHLLMCDPAPDLWRSETLEYTLSEGEQGHAKSPKDLYRRV